MREDVGTILGWKATSFDFPSPGLGKKIDSISLVRLGHALHQFGLPMRICNLIQLVYSGETFAVLDGGVKSVKHKQAFGISQGCLQSVFLFSMLMTVLLHGSNDNVQPCGDDFILNELVFADDIQLSPQTRTR